ncbi:hypothetical protein LU604_10965 [Erwinia tracheiphila]|uniref:Uncharacterized protein n=1 Tax=Erwinia tracheiphila TaxID=65700 RepID=A0A345CRH6_9GAMM|nr:hypothetical protein [Erwinia tracheiphila]AXF76043.1 hypothetical protein AV903_08290 [Erwinia tracheiphila]UIA85295.1 hypothetical protein LU604_10965 [Erwinia tracheiphila]
MSIYFRTYNRAGKLLFDATIPAYICVSKSTIVLNPASSNYYSGLAAWATVSFTCKTKYPPMIFVRSESAGLYYYRACVCVASLTKSGNTWSFTIWGEMGVTSQTVTYYVFAAPEELSKQREGVMALWNESGEKVFDSNYKYLIVTAFNQVTSSSLPGNFTTPLDSTRKYAFCNTQLSGFDDFGGNAGVTVAAVDRFQFWQDAAGSVTYGLAVLNDALVSRPAGYFQNFNTSYMIADVTSV